MRFPSRLSGDDGRAEGQGTSPRHVVAHGATKRLGLSSSRGPREATKGPRSPSRAPSPSSPSICMYMSLLAMLLAALSVSVPRAAASPFRSEMQLAGHQVQRVTDFLIKYGYIPKGDLSSGALRSESHLRAAVQRMQHFANLPETGDIDNATLALMSRPRCGLPDYIVPGSDMPHPAFRVKRYALQGSKWPKTDLTWSVKHWPRNIDSRVLRTELQRALGVWSDVSKLTFKETRSADADIVVSFLSGPHGDDYAFDGPGNILAHAFFPGQAIGGDAHFDADEKWAQTGSASASKPHNSVNEHDSAHHEEGVSLFGVAAHEFGHSLGLSHSSVAGSLMFPYYQVTKDDFKLPYDDTVGIQQLYGAKNPSKWAPMPPLPTDAPSVPGEHPRVTERPRDPTSPSFTPDETPDHIPKTCETNFDAISSIRREIFLFKGKYFWRLNDNKNLERAYPIEINHFWFKLPSTLEKIDAVYERPHDKKIVFFVGRKYWVFSGNNPEPGFPRPLTDLGFPKHIERIDAAMVWGHNGKTYLFSGNKYWRLEESEGKVELDYPRSMEIWRGVPFDIDAAFQWHRNGITYFFKDDHFWEFNNRKMVVTRDSPKSAIGFWFDSVCKETPQSRNPVSSDSSNSSPHLLPSPQSLCLLRIKELFVLLGIFYAYFLTPSLHAVRVL